MIALEDLIEVLQQNDCPSNIVNEYINKKTLLKDGKKSEIGKIFKILVREKLNLSKCATVLAQGNSEVIEDIIKVLKDERLDVNKFISVLCRNDANELYELITILKSLTLDLNKCSKILAKAKPSKVNDIVRIVGRVDLDVSDGLQVLTRTNITELDELVDILENYSELIDKEHWLTILSRANKKDLEDVISILTEEKLDLNNFISVLASGKEKEITPMIKVLKEHNIDLNLCSSVLAKGKFVKVNKCIEILTRLEIDFSNCLSALLCSNPNEIDDMVLLLKKERIDPKYYSLILARRKYSQIKDITEVLKKYKELSVKAKDCPVILAYGNAEEIDEILPLIIRNSINIDGYLSVIAYGKVDNMKKIIKFLSDKQIDINLYPGILAQISYSEVLDISSLLDDNSIPMERIFKLKLGNKVFFRYGYSRLRELFIRKEKNNLSIEDIKLLFKMEGKYNSYYTKEDIDRYCLEYNISVNEFIENFCRCKGDLRDLLVNRMNNGKKIWVGGNYSLGSDEIEKYAKIMIKVSKFAARKFMFMTGFSDRYELESKSIDNLIEFCGGLFYNYSDNEPLLTAILINYCYKRLFCYLCSDLNYIDNNDYHTSSICESTNNVFDIEEMESFKDIGLTEMEKDFLVCMNKYLLLTDDDYETFVKNDLGLDDNSYEQMNESIRNKVLKKSLNQ